MYKLVSRPVSENIRYSTSKDDDISLRINRSPFEDTSTVPDDTFDVDDIVVRCKSNFRKLAKEDPDQLDGISTYRK
ncbi:hypothetical protein HOG98_04660 [bacterium]|jgi:hypothetical protein|nr:hypothetical protein [bacterium]